MFLTLFKPKIQKLLKKPANFLAELGLTPLILTIISFLFVPFAIYLIINKMLIIGGVILLLSYIVDGMDGVVARITNKVTNVGDFLDKTVDTSRQACWIALAYGNFISFELASSAVFFAVFGYAVGNYIRLNDLKNLNVPVVFDVVILAVLTTKVELFAFLAIIITAILILINVAIVILVNKKK